jgi:hypothetical protein
MTPSAFERCALFDRKAVGPALSAARSIESVAEASGLHAELVGASCTR